MHTKEGRELVLGSLKPAEFVRGFEELSPGLGGVNVLSGLGAL